MAVLPNDTTLLNKASIPSIDRLYDGKAYLVGVDAAGAALPGLVPGSGGQSPYTSLSSIYIAHSKCYANRQDVIYCHPAHIEPVLIAAGSLTLSKADVSVVGINCPTTGRKPTISFSTATSASLLVSGNGVRLKNLFFNLTGIDALANPLDITGTDCIIEDCDFLLTKTAATAAQATLAIRATSANGMIIRNCRFYCEADSTTNPGGDPAAGSVAAISLNGGDNILLVGNYINGFFTTTVGGIRSVTTATTRVRLRGNTIINNTTAATRACSWVATSTPIIENGNYCHLGNGAAGNVGLGTAAADGQPAFGVGPSGLTTGKVGVGNYWANTNGVTPTIY